MVIAIPIWNNRVAPVFDTTSNLLLFQAEEEQFSQVGVKNMRNSTCNEKLHIIAQSAAVFICGAIPFRFEQELTDRDVRVIPFIAGEVSEIITAFASGSLENPKYKMPGCKHRSKRGKNCRYVSNN